MRVHTLNTKHALTDDSSTALYWTITGEDILMYKGESIGRTTSRIQVGSPRTKASHHHVGMGPKAIQAHSSSS